MSLDIEIAFYKSKMRNRSQAHTTNVSGTRQTIQISNGAVLDSSNWSVNIVDYESLMWDDPTGGTRVNKPVTHCSYVVDDLSVSREAYHSGNATSAPNPHLRFTAYHGGSEGQLNSLRPPSLLGNTANWISVTGQTTDDIGDCVFNAYNQFVNGVRALDASVSLAELGEIPRLFDLWQRRRALPSNIVNGFLNYSFGWKPLLSDLKAITRELRSFPKTVRKRLKAIGDGYVVRHYKFTMSSTVDSLNHVTLEGQDHPYGWAKYLRNEKSVSKSRVVCVTIRAKVKPKLTGEGQDLLNKLGALGLVPSLATLWSVTRLSFVVDWFYNIGGAIENLQGSLTHDLSEVTVCVSDSRTRVIEVRNEDTSGYNNHVVGRVTQKFYTRAQHPSIPLLPSFRVPRRPMQYVLLGLVSLVSTKRGKIILRGLDQHPLSQKVTNAIVNSVVKGARGARESPIVSTLAKLYGRPGG
jgi:hypothetical protein